MKNLVTVFILSMFLMIGCTTTKYIPVESVRTEYKSKVEKDTIIINNDKIIKEKGDTVYITETKYVYKTNNKTDTILKIDTIPIIQEVEVIKEVNRIKNWQSFLMILGGGVIAIGGYKLIKKLKV